MKTLLIEADRLARFPAASRGEALHFQRPGALRQALPQWLPAPAAARPIPQAKASRSKLWIVNGRESIGERILFGLLILSAVIAIGYGFNSLVELVENWAGFTSTISQIIP